MLFGLAGLVGGVWVVDGVWVVVWWGFVVCLCVLSALVFSLRTFSVGADMGERAKRGELCVFQNCLFEF